MYPTPRWTYEKLHYIGLAVIKILRYTQAQIQTMTSCLYKHFKYIQRFFTFGVSKILVITKIPLRSHFLIVIREIDTHTDFVLKLLLKAMNIIVLVTAKEPGRFFFNY